MKYRIKQCGESMFVPQYKGWFFWNKFNDYFGPHGGYGTIKFNTLQEAKEYIDRDIENDKYIRSLDTVKYHKHP